MRIWRYGVNGTRLLYNAPSLTGQAPSFLSVGGSSMREVERPQHAWIPSASLLCAYKANLAFTRSFIVYTRTRRINCPQMKSTKVQIPRRIRSCVLCQCACAEIGHAGLHGARPPPPGREGVGNKIYACALFIIGHATWPSTMSVFLIPNGVF